MKIKQLLNKILPTPLVNLGGEDSWKTWIARHDVGDSGPRWVDHSHSQLRFTHRSRLEQLWL